MKKKTLLISLLMLTCFGMAKANIIEIGDGTNNVTTDVLPTRARYEFSLTQQIYTSEEIGLTGTINSIAFYKTSEGSATRFLDIYMRPTTMYSFPGSLDWEPVMEDYLVFSGQVTFESGCWTPITLSVPYEYYSRQNLLITVNDKTNDYSEGKVTFRAMSAPGASLYVYNESEGYQPTEPDLYTYVGTVGDQKTSIQLDITPVKEGIVKVGGGLRATSMLPANRSSKYAFTEQIYTTDELGSAGTIKKISFKTNNNAWGINGGDNKVDIYMVHTPKDNFTGPYDWIDFSESDKVYSGYISHYYINSMSTVTLNTPFEYDGLNNVVLIVVQNNGAEVSGPYAECLSFSAGNQSLAYYSSSVPFDLTKISSYEGTLWGDKNQIWFDIVPSAAIGLDGTNRTNMLPINTSKNFSYSQQIYTNTDINQKGYIESVSFYCVNTAANPADRTRNIDVYLKHTYNSEFYNYNSWEEIREEDKYFSGNVTLEGGKWIKIALDKPFKYNGYNNLVVAIDDNTGTSITDYGSETAGFFATYAIPGHSMSILKSSDADIDVASPGSGEFYIADYYATNYGNNKIIFGFHETWQIGEGSDMCDVLPYAPLDGYHISQQIYTDVELGKENADITSIAFYNGGESYGREATLDIYLTSPTYPSSYEDGNSWIKVNPEDMVFSGNVSFPAGEWTDIPLNRVFHYSRGGGGIHNLVLTVVDRSGPSGHWGLWSDFLVYNAEAQAIYAPSPADDTSKLFTPEDMSGITGTVLNVKNQIRLNNVPVNIRPINLRTTNVGFSSATLQWNKPAIAVDSYILQYKPEDATDWKTVVISDPNATSYDLVNINARTNYVARLQMEYSSNLSDWAETSFSTDLKPTYVNYDVTYNSAVITWDGPSELWDFQYKREGESSWKGEINISDKTYSLTELEETTEYYFRIRATDGNDNYGSWVEYSFWTPVRYPSPNDIIAENVGVYSATISWDEGGYAKNWQICINDDEEHLIDVNSVRQIDPTRVAYVMTGLEQGTFYDLKVRSVYPEEGAYSKWSYTINFATLSPNPIPYDIAITTTNNSAAISWAGESDSYEVRYRKAAELLVQDFENGMGLWDAYNLASSSGISYGSFYFSYYSAPEYQYLISPELKNIPEGAKFSFLHHSWGVNNSFKVGYSTTTNDVDDPSVFTWTDELSSSDWDWHTYSLTLPAGVKYIAFQNYTDLSNQYASLYLDNLAITVDGAEPGDWMSVETTKREATLTDLEKETVYQYKIIGHMADQPDAETDFGYFTTIPYSSSSSILGEISVDVTPTTALFNWSGNFDMYKLEYRTAEKGAFTENETIFFEDDFDPPFNWIEYGDYHNSGVISNWGIDDGYAYEFETVGMFPTQTISKLVENYTPDGAELTFAYKGLNDYNGMGLSVGYSTTDWDLGSFTWVNIEDDILDPELYQWKTYTLTLPEAVKYIAFQWSDIGSGSVLIDKVKISTNEIIGYMEPAGPWQTVWTNEPTAYVTGLEKGTTYDYRLTCIYLGGGEALVGIHQFTTPDEPIDIAMDAKGLNQATITDNDGVYANVTIQNLTLRKDGQWQSICLPFNLEVEGSVLEGADVRTYEDAKLYIASGVATLDFLTPVTKMKAGTPYIIRWNSGADIENPTFECVTIRDELNTLTYGDQVSFVPNYDAFTTTTWPFVIEGSAELVMAQEGTEVEAFTCYFTTEYPYSTMANTFVLNTGDNADMITGIASPRTETEEGAIYNLSGQRLSKKQRGINIVNGKKIAIK